jgi:hypothetical protein
MKPMNVLKRICYILGVFLALTAATRSSGDNSVAVQIPGSGIELLSVFSDMQTEFNVVTNPDGNVYFNDCATIQALPGHAPLEHAKLIFAAVDNQGEVKRPLLALDLTFKRRPLPATLGGCRDHAYENGDRGLRLVAWVNVADFADGTHWQAPPIDQMTPYILDALPKGP